jgi:hypothetical protein
MGLATGIITVGIILANDLTFEEFILKKLQKILKEVVKYFINAKIRPCYLN